MGMGLGMRIWELRQACHMTQAELAKAAGISRSFLAQLERGMRTDIAFSRAVGLAAALGVTLDDLARPSSRDPSDASQRTASFPPAPQGCLPWPQEPGLLALAQRLRAQGHPFWPLEGWSLSGAKWQTVCPHHGAEVRLKAEEIRGYRRRRTVIQVEAACGCSRRRLLRAWGVNPELGEPATGLTIEELARHVGLPADYLRGLGVRERAGRVEIPYRDFQGREVGVEKRLALRKEDRPDRQRFERATLPVPYGLDRFRDAEKARYVIIVEGASDCWTLWYKDFPALGLPGADTAGLLTEPMLWPLERVVVVQEADPAGQEFAQQVRARVANLAPDVRVQVLAMPPDAKDMNAKYRQKPQAFAAWLRRAIEEAAHPGSA